MDSTLCNKKMRSVLIEALERLTTIFWVPTPESCQEMADGTFWAPFEVLEPFLNYDPPDAVARLKEMCATAKNGSQLADQLETDYVTAFVNRLGGIRASLDSSSYFGDDATLMGAPARLMEASFAAKGLQLATDRNEPPDHLAIQLEFCFFLLAQEKSDTARQEAAQFIRDALLPWVPQFHAGLRTETPFDFYALTASLLVGVLNLISELR